MDNEREACKKGYDMFYALQKKNILISRVFPDLKVQ